MRISRSFNRKGQNNILILLWDGCLLCFHTLHWHSLLRSMVWPFSLACVWRWAEKFQRCSDRVFFLSICGKPFPGRSNGIVYGKPIAFKFNWSLIWGNYSATMPNANFAVDAFSASVCFFFKEAVEWGCWPKNIWFSKEFISTTSRENSPKVLTRFREACSGNENSLFSAFSLGKKYWESKRCFPLNVSCKRCLHNGLMFLAVEILYFDCGFGINTIS